MINQGSSSPSFSSSDSLSPYYQPIHHYSSPTLTQYFYPPLFMDSYPPHIQQTASPSSPIHCLPNKNNSSSIRYNVSLEAPTAASQKIDEPPLTYLNKGQYYNITLRDNNKFDGDIISVVSITFHDKNHRLGATDYWRFWLTQQKDSENARAVEIDIARSSGAQAIECRRFDRISFKWNGELGASVHIRFKCLSTDFSRIKGVKGIPLRLQIESMQSHQSEPERTYCRIKLFRDKGAERKNKDDAKHIERQLEKNRGKNGEPHPLWLAFSPTVPVTLFREVIPPEDEESNYHHLEDARYSQEQSFAPAVKRSFTSFNNEIQNDYTMPSVTPAALSIVPNAIGMDPTYVPQRRRRIAKLLLLVKFGACEVYRAIYLQHLTVKELIDKLVVCMAIKKPVSGVLRKICSKDNTIIVEVNDEVVKDITEAQPMFVEVSELQGGSLKLVLNF
ncbi:hypothetical protein MFLAVUS_001597 [Mucor flavus]|uniref:Grh/CP2 DB domain-containing protein n=1 Tax=Mucor flavus TaxID=439312 RepID=A0ABP9YMZ3_9FUNG